MLSLCGPGGCLAVGSHRSPVRGGREGAIRGPWVLRRFSVSDIPDVPVCCGRAETVYGPGAEGRVGGEAW